MALNRVGMPRKTHLPANKPLGKLSTYVKSFTLIVAEQRSDAVIGQRFGMNHVKHALKHLCESGKELIELSAKRLIQPECGSTSSHNNSSIGSSLGIATSNSMKKQPNHNMRHANGGHHRKLVPAALTDRSQHRKTTVGAHHSARPKASDCVAPQCTPKKKKLNNGGGAMIRKNVNVNKKNVKKSNQKSTKAKSIKKLVVTTARTTTTTSTKATTPASILDSSISGADSYDDELEDSSVGMPLPTNSHSALLSDEDYEEDK